MLEPLIVEGSPDAATDAIATDIADAAADGVSTIVAAEAPEGCPSVDDLLVEATEVLGANTEVLNIAGLGEDDADADADVDSDTDLVD